MIDPVGFIGLGIMGRPIAENLCRAGVQVTVFDANPEACRPLKEAGAAVADSLDELAKSCKTIMMIVPNGQIVESILFGKAGLCQSLQEGALICDMSSVSAKQAQSFAKRLKASSGAEYMDSPVSGGEPKAISGDLTIMAGCSEEQFARMEPYYAIIGAAWNRVGDVGKGSVAKFCNQIIVTANIAAICEAAAFAEKNGMDLRLLFDVLKIGSANSSMMSSRTEKILNRDFRPGGPIETHLKDIRNVLKSADQLGVKLPIAQELEKMLAEHSEAGNGRMDSSSLLLYYEKEFGINAEM